MSFGHAEGGCGWALLLADATGKGAAGGGRDAEGSTVVDERGGKVGGGEGVGAGLQAALLTRMATIRK
jgi:hypothetical protein